MIKTSLVLPTPSTSVPVDLPSIDNRLASIRSQRKSLPYEKQKSSLQKQLEMFLGSLPSPRNLQSATPLDLARFLVWKDGKGKTNVHTSRCPLFGTHSKNHCKCLTRLGAATVDSTIGKLRAIFNSAGRCGPWNELFCIGNPANDSSVQSYLQFITKEQTAGFNPTYYALVLLKFRHLCSVVRVKWTSTSKLTNF